MAQFNFDPPLMLTSNVAVITLDDAAAFMRSFGGERRPTAKQSVLRRLEGSRTEEEERDAANDFEAWAQAEGLLLRPRSRP
jgi:hypothetical protein